MNFIRIENTILSVIQLSIFFELFFTHQTWLDTSTPKLSPSFKTKTGFVHPTPPPVWFVLKLSELPLSILPIGLASLFFTTEWSSVWNLVFKLEFRSMLLKLPSFRHPVKHRSEDDENVFDSFDVLGVIRRTGPLEPPDNGDAFSVSGGRMYSKFKNSLS